MKEIISAIDKDLLIAELSNEKFICNSNRGNHKIFVVNNNNSPNIMQEIGRLREIAYRHVGSGTGNNLDIDSLDTAEVPYNQLIIWDSDNSQIVGGYRYILCRDAHLDKNNIPIIGTARFFNYSNNFLENYMPYTIELGRSFINPELQATNNLRKGIFVLNNLWDGLGMLVKLNPDIKYFLGQVSIFKNLSKLSHDLILYFLKKDFPNTDRLLTPKISIEIKTNIKELESIFIGKNINENYRILSKTVRSLHENIPPLINSYINTSATMQTFGAIHNSHFKNMEDVGIMITIADIYKNKKKRHIPNY